MLNLSWKRTRAVLGALAAAAILVPGIAMAQDGEGAPEPCEITLSGASFNPPDLDATGSGTAQLITEPDPSIQVSFTGVANVSNVGLFADNGISATEIVNIATGSPVSPVSLSLTTDDTDAIVAALEAGQRVLVVVQGDTDTIAGSINPCLGFDDEGFRFFCFLPLAGTGAGSGSTLIRLNLATGEAKFSVEFTGVASNTGVGIYEVLTGGVLGSEVVHLADTGATSPVDVTITAEQFTAIGDAIAAGGADIVVQGGADAVSAHLGDCAVPEEGEGGVEGGVEGEGEGVIEGGIEGEGEGTPALTGLLRIVHGATSIGNVDICVNGELITEAGGLAFGSVGEYDTVDSDFYTISVYAAGDGCAGTEIASNSFFLGADQAWTVALADIDVKGVGVQIFPIVDDTTPAVGFAKVRVINLSSDSSSVDVFLDQDLVFDDVLYGPFGTYENVDPGIYVPTVKRGDGTVLATGSAIAMGDGGVYTIYVLGLTTGTPAVQASTTADVEGGVVEGEEGEGGTEGEGEGVVEGEGEGDVEGPIDFCALQDELAGIIDDPILGPVLADLLGEDISLLGLLACDVADLNGELPVLEGAPEAEGPSIADQLPGPNGLLDGPFELAVLQELINNPGPYADLAANGGVTAGDVGAAFDANEAIALGSLAGVPPEDLAPLFGALLGDSLEGEVEGEGAREEIILRAAGLVPNIGKLLAGYITLGDDNSVAVAVLVLTFINDATDGILGLGIDPTAYTRLNGILSADGDADGDGCTQRGEFEALGDTPTTEAYVAAALDPDTADCPAPIDFCAVMDDLAGVATDPVLGPVLADLLGPDIAILEQLACDVADLNGPLPAVEGEGETPIADQLPDPNGILDGPFELAVLQELINNPGPYADLQAAGGVDASAVGAAFQANLAIALGSLAGVPPEDLAPLFGALLGSELEGEIEGQGARDEIILRAAELVPNIGLLLAGYITLGDDNSVAVAVLVLTFINDATDGILGLGVDPSGYTRLDGILSITGDADADGCTQGQEYLGIFGTKGNDTQTYVSAVLDPDLHPSDCAPEGEGGGDVFYDGDTDQDGLLGLSELLRIVQLYNAGGYSCSIQVTEDGYQVGNGGTAVGTGGCEAHDVDFDSTQGSISLSELLRAIQLFNLHATLVFTGGAEGGWTVVV